MAKAPQARIWEEWDKPATKGDLVRALVSTRSCIVDIYSALIAVRIGDDEKLMKEINSLAKHDEELSALIDELGGRKGG